MKKTLLSLLSVIGMMTVATNSYGQTPCTVNEIDSMRIQYESPCESVIGVMNNVVQIDPYLQYTHSGMFSVSYADGTPLPSYWNFDPMTGHLDYGETTTLDNGFYRLTFVEDITGCVDVQDFELKVYPTPNISLGENYRCNGWIYVPINQVDPHATYFWQNNSGGWDAITDSVFRKVLPPTGSGQSGGIGAQIIDAHGCANQTATATTLFHKFFEAMIVQNGSNLGVVNLSQFSIGTYQWKKGNSSVGTGSTTPIIGNGKYSVRLVSDQLSGKCARSYSVQILGGQVQRMEDQGEELPVEMRIISANPTSAGTLTLSGVYEDVFVYDLMGRALVVVPVENDGNSKEVNIDISSLKESSYIIRCGSESQKLIKVK